MDQRLASLSTDFATHGGIDAHLAAHRIQTRIAVAADSATPLNGTVSLPALDVDPVAVRAGPFHSHDTGHGGVLDP